MEQIRKPFQGVLNIIRFNWHFYVIAFSLVLILILIEKNIDKSFQSYIFALIFLILSSILISLLTSYYVYDLSGLYKLKWIDSNNKESLIININAGFDETSSLLQNKFKNAEFIALDFYNPRTHTEISIKRARKAYSQFPNTIAIETSNTKLLDDSVDKIFVILSAHEIRNDIERIIFFKELKRIIKPNGKIYITEHLRDLPNFLAYNLGFLHFYSKNSWLHIFKNANLNVRAEIKITPFISTFILNKNGDTL